MVRPALRRNTGFFEDPLQDQIRYVYLVPFSLGLWAALLVVQVPPKVLLTVPPPGARRIWTVDPTGEMKRPEVSAQFLLASERLLAFGTGHGRWLGRGDGESLRQGVHKTYQLQVPSSFTRTTSPQAGASTGQRNYRRLGGFSCSWMRYRCG